MPPAALLLLVACLHPVAVTSHPSGAVVSFGGQIVGQAPVTVPVPLRGGEVMVEVAGYRPYVRRLTWWTPRRLEIRLVAEHGPAGTWQPEDVR